MQAALWSDALLLPNIFYVTCVFVSFPCRLQVYFNFTGTSVNSEITVQEKPSNKLKALEELDALGELLLKENLQSNIKKLDQQFNKYVLFSRFLKNSST